MSLLDIDITETKVGAPHLSRTNPGDQITTAATTDSLYNITTVLLTLTNKSTARPNFAVKMHMLVPKNYMACLANFAKLSVTLKEHKSPHMITFSANCSKNLGYIHVNISSSTIPS
jgi:hypothetical protein